MKDYIFIAVTAKGEIVEAIPFTWDTLAGVTAEDKERTLKSWMQGHVFQMSLFKYSSKVRVFDKQITLEFSDEPCFISCNIVEISRNFQYITNNNQMILDELSADAHRFELL